MATSAVDGSARRDASVADSAGMRKSVRKEREPREDRGKYIKLI